MAAPTPRDAVPTPSYQTTVTPNGSSVNFTVTLMPHQAGDYLVVFLALNNVTSVTPPAGWSAVRENGTGGAWLGIYQQSTLAASSSETNPVFSVLSGGGGTGVAHPYSIPITGGSILRAHVNGAAGSSTAADPPSLTPFGGTQDYLWFALASVKANTAISAGPSGYSNFTASSNSTSVTLGTAWKQSTATTADNPSAFTNTSTNWVANTFAVWDTVGGGGGGGSTRAATNMLLGIG